MKEVKLMEIIIIGCFFIVLFNFLEYGLVWIRLDQFAYPVLLTIITLAIIYIPKLRKFSLIASFTAFFIMISLYLVNKLNLANVIGSFGFALLLITLSIYLPQIVKKGFIE